MHARATLLALLATAAMATAAGAQSKPPGEPADPAIVDGSAKRALDAARLSWRTYGARSYRFRIAHHCFCGPSVTGARTIVVRGGKPVRPPSDLMNVATIPRLQRLIKSQIDAGVASLSVTYGAHGVPRAISIDVSRSIADEEQSYTIDRFKRLA
jgi:hypothetical protein